ncbi:MAG: glycosyltransferase family 2 protein [Phycisphaerales bacterium]
MRRLNTGFAQLIVVAAGDARNDLERLFASLEPQIADGRATHVTLADHSENDDLRSFDDRPWLSYRGSGKNIGYGPAINEAAESANFEWVIACNADLEFPPGAVAAMTRVLSRQPPEVGLVAPQLLNPPGESPRHQPSVGRFPTLASLLLGRLRDRRRRKYERTSDRPHDIDWATGACLAVRGHAFAALGGFDAAIFLDYEDTDLCRRLASAGWRRRLEPEWTVVHWRPNAHRPADPTRHRHTRASLMRYFQKHRPRWEVRTLATLMRLTLLVRPRSPFADGWRAGLEIYRRGLSQA